MISAERENVWLLSLKDLATPKMAAYALVPLVLTLVVMYTLVIGAVEDLFAAVEAYEHRAAGESAVVDFLLHNVVTSWLVRTLVYLSAGYLSMQIAIFVALFIIGFFTPLIVREIHTRHYAGQFALETDMRAGAVIAASIRYVAITLAMIPVMLPLLFIPLLNLIALHLPFYYLFHKLLLLDVGSETMRTAQFERLRAEGGGTLRIRTLGLYLISTLIPFAAYVMPIFNVIVMTHTVMRRRIQLDD